MDGDVGDLLAADPEENVLTLMAHHFMRASSLLGAAPPVCAQRLRHKRADTDAHTRQTMVGVSDKLLPRRLTQMLRLLASLSDQIFWL